MAIMKKFKKRTIRKTRKRWIKRSIPRTINPNSAMVSVKRTWYSGSWQLSTTGTTDFWRYFEPTIAGASSLNPGFNNFAEFASVFDRYRVNGIRLTFRPRFDNVAAPVTGATPLITVLPYITTKIDPQTTLNPTGTYGSGTLNTLFEHGGKTRKITNSASVYFRPQIALPTNVGGGVIYRKAPYLSTSTTSIPMRGAHVYLHTNNFSAGTAMQDVLVDVYVTWYVTFKNIK